MAEADLADTHEDTSLSPPAAQGRGQDSTLRFFARYLS